MYIPHEGSKYNKDIFPNLTCDIETIYNDYGLPMMLIGDFNSRTRKLNDIMLYESNDYVLTAREYKYPDTISTFKGLDIPLVRSNKDTDTNNNGHKLIELCKITELCIVNGRIGSDKDIGNTTCAEKSTIDYVLCTPDLLPNLTDYTVDLFDPCSLTNTNQYMYI